MKAKENTDKLVKVTQKGLLALVSDRLKGRVLFPEKIEEAKRLLKNIEIAK